MSILLKSFVVRQWGISPGWGITFISVGRGWGGYSTPELTKKIITLKLLFQETTKTAVPYNNIVRAQ